jgi:hypothetical protein
MICPENILLEHGLVGAFDSMAMMYDEELAIMVEVSSNERIPPDILDDPDSERIGYEVRDLQSLTYIEVQMASQELAAHLYHRFGVRRGDPVAIICHGHSAAEVLFNATSYRHYLISLKIRYSNEMLIFSVYRMSSVCENRSTICTY